MLRAALALSLLSLAACAAPPPQPMADNTTAPVAGFIVESERPAFDAFIATRPTPEAFRARYPDVTLVLPGMIATKEMRMNFSRYFAQLDEAGRIVGGRFQ